MGAPVRSPGPGDEHERCRDACKLPILTVNDRAFRCQDSPPVVHELGVGGEWSRQGLTIVANVHVSGDRHLSIDVTLRGPRARTFNPIRAWSGIGSAAFGTPG